MEIIEEIKFEIEGVAPLKMDRWMDLPQPKNEQGYLEQAKQKVYRDEKGNLAVPANALKASIRCASSEVGKKMMAKKNRQAIRAQMFIEPEMLSLGRKDYDEIVRDIISRGTGDKVTRVPTYRPLVKNWSITGTIKLIGIPHDFVKECIQVAGLKYGLLGHRPEFGRFMLKKFEVVDNGKKGK